MLLSATAPPSQPTNIFIETMNVGPTFARVCWQLPAFKGIPAVSRYVITATPVDGGTDSLTFYHNDTRRDFNVTGLAPGTRYEFHVIAISESEGIAGKSPQSNSGFANTTFTGTFLSIFTLFLPDILSCTSM